jgi:hypothetical protein
MSGTHLPAAVVFFVATAVGLLGTHLAIGRGLWGVDTVRVWYRSEGLPYYFRNAVGIQPVLALASLCLAAAVGLAGVPDSPTVAILLLFVAVALLMQLSWIVAYRVPAPFLPPWLRAEIDAGITPVARPTRGDWVLFAMFSLLFTGGAILVTVLALPPLLASP